MKKKSKNAIIRKKKEFRYHSVELKNKKDKMIKINHPAYIFLKKGNVLIYVSITHSNKVEEKLLVKLHKNPNPLDKSDSFWVAEIKEDTKDRFGKIRTEWKIDEEDDYLIREFYKKEKR